MNKAKVNFLEGRLFSSQSGFLKTFQIALIGRIKAGPPKKPLLFWEIRLLSSQSERSEKFSKSSD